MEAPVTVIVSEDGKRSGGDGRDAQRAEVAAIETVGDSDIHEEDFILGERAAALPNGQRAITAIAFERRSREVIFDSDGRAVAADRRPGNGNNALHQRHATRQIPALREERCER
jgi:hypothetical protein